MQHTDLRTGWTVRAIGGDRSGFVPESYPAEVPGCVHTDLMTAGVIPDPYLDGNEAGLRWMHDIDWRYSTVLDPRTIALEAPASGERVDLVFDGIDTIATVWLGEGPDKIELGLGTGHTYRWFVEAGPARALEHRPAGSGHARRDSRFRWHRSS